MPCSLFIRLLNTTFANLKHLFKRTRLPARIAAANVIHELVSIQMTIITIQADHHLHISRGAALRGVGGTDPEFRLTSTASQIYLCMKVLALVRLCSHLTEHVLPELVGISWFEFSQSLSP